MIFTLLSSGRKNCWEGNEQVNQMFKNILKKKKITLRTGAAYHRAKKETYYPK